MSNIHGTDLMLLNGDLAITPAGDLKTVTGPACICQDIIKALDLINYLNDCTVNDNYLKNIIQEVVIKDPRVKAETVDIKINNDYNKLKIEICFVPIGSTNSENLVYEPGDKIKV